MSSRTGAVLLASVAATVLVLDQATKWAVRGWLPRGGAWPASDTLVGRFFSFTHVHNTGVAFGLGQGRSDLFVLVAFAVVGALVVYQARLPADERWLRLAIGLQVGGAVGNLLDRLRLGHVTDFFDFKFWPVFNVADSAIVVGVLMMAWHFWRQDAAAGGSVEPGPAAPATLALDERGD